MQKISEGIQYKNLTRKPKILEENDNVNFRRRKKVLAGN